MAKRRRSPSPDQDTSDLEPCSKRSRTAEWSDGKPVQRNAANARERARMRVLSRAFCRLKTCLPWVPRDTKLSKLDTLRLAATYIAHLRKLLREEEEDTALPHPVTFTWPFSLNSRTVLGTACSNSDLAPMNSPLHSIPRAVQEDCVAFPGSTDYAQDIAADYRHLVPCEYMALDQATRRKRESVGHYLQHG